MKHTGSPRGSSLLLIIKKIPLSTLRFAELNSTGVNAEIGTFTIQPHSPVPLDDEKSPIYILNPTKREIVSSVSPWPRQPNPRLTPLECRSEVTIIFNETLNMFLFFRNSYCRPCREDKVP